LLSTIDILYLRKNYKVGDKCKKRSLGLFQRHVSGTSPRGLEATENSGRVISHSQ